ncbi:MAG: hypothetical protein DI585_00150 [Pseudomonas fluorescens]|nr:MAG: hypothetical protein DI585_00150 [Pseudomonas fluorescens]
MHLTHPHSPHFNQHYWSLLASGPAEKAHTYLHGNHLPARFSTQPFTVAELGFGTGLTFLLTWALACHTGTPLTFISYELHPLSLTELEPIHAAFPPELQPLATQLRTAYTSTHGWNLITLEGVTLHLYIGDATQGILTHPHPAHAWFLDGFSADVNPALWSESLFHHIYAHTTSGGTATTYSVARAVRNALGSAGFHTQKVKGHYPKFHMLAAHKPARTPD